MSVQIFSRINPGDFFCDKTVTTDPVTLVRVEDRRMTTSFSTLEMRQHLGVTTLSQRLQYTHGEKERRLIRMKNKNYVFVYGTLRKHEANHHFLKEARCISQQCWTHGILYDTGNGYPAMVSGGQRVYGELYEVTAEQLKRLDILEGYKGVGRDNHYERSTQVIHTDFATSEAYVYVYSQPIRDFKEIRFGDWKCHRYLQQGEFLYFAYGSCMDTERFEDAGVKHQFDRVIGCGVAESYSLAYTRKSRDGGRADLIESNEQVEGKVYQITSETLPYLYRREGVTANIYRPAFIEVKINNKLYKNVLTFFVVEKEDEVAPPPHYATEILRGAKGFVSEAYYQKLVDDLNVKFGKGVWSCEISIKV